MVQPIENAINWFLGFFNAMPISVRNFMGLTFALFGIAVLIKLLYHAR